MDSPGINLAQQVLTRVGAPLLVALMAWFGLKVSDNSDANIRQDVIIEALTQSSQSVDTKLAAIYVELAAIKESTVRVEERTRSMDNRERKENR